MKFGPGHQGLGRLVGDLLVHRVSVGYVRWIGRDDIEAVCHIAARRRRQQVGRGEGDARLNAVSRGIALGNRNGLGADVGGQDTHVRNLLGHGDGDASRAGTHVPHPARASRTVRGRTGWLAGLAGLADLTGQMPDRRADQGLGLRTRYQNVAGDLEAQRIKFLASDQVSDGLVAGGSFDQRAELGQLLGGWLLFESGVKLDALTAQAVGQEHLGREPGGGDTAAGQVLLGPVQDGQNRPWSSILW